MIFFHNASRWHHYVPELTEGEKETFQLLTDYINLFLLPIVVYLDRAEGLYWWEEDEERKHCQ